MANNDKKKSKKGLIAGISIAGFVLLYVLGAVGAMLLTGSVALLAEMLIVLIGGSAMTGVGYGIGRGVYNKVTKSSSQDNSKSKDRNRQLSKEEQMEPVPVVKKEKTVTVVNKSKKAKTTSKTKKKGK